METTKEVYNTLQQRKWYEADEEPILFRDDVDTNDPDLEAIKHIQNEGTPEEIAEVEKKHYELMITRITNTEETKIMKKLQKIKRSIMKLWYITQMQSKQNQAML